MESKVKKQAEQDARRLFRADGGETFAVSPAGIAARLGVDVREPELDLDIRGALFMEPNLDPRIHINKRDGFLRRRLTCAMELGHYLFMSARTDRYKRVDLSHGSEERDGESSDVYARQFASSLLMPRELVDVLSDLQADGLEMSLRLFVPREAMQKRLRELGLARPCLEAA